MSDFNEDKAVAELAEIVALECGYSSAMARKIRAAAVLHDIGKQKLPARLLGKSGRLTPDEFEVVKTHTTLGAAMLKTMQGDLGEMARQIAAFHHEKFSGRGYWCKRPDQIPAYVPVVTIADIYAALVCVRPYKDAWTKDAALDYIQNQSGKRFDPRLVEVFIPLARSDSRVAAIFKGVMYYARRDRKQKRCVSHEHGEADRQNAGKADDGRTPEDEGVRQ